MQKLLIVCLMPVRQVLFLFNVFRHEFLKLSYFPVLHVHFMIAWHQSLP